MSTNTVQLDNWLRKLHKATFKTTTKGVPLKFELGTTTLPQVSTRSDQGLLTEMDSRLQGFVETVGRLPHDTPGVFFYANYRDGGMSVTCLKHSGD